MVPRVAIHWSRGCVTQSAGDLNLRYTEARLTPSTQAMADTSGSPESCIALAVAHFSSIYAVDLPPLRLLARAVWSPAMERSRKR